MGMWAVSSSGDLETMLYWIFGWLLVYTLLLGTHFKAEMFSALLMCSYIYVLLKIFPESTYSHLCFHYSVQDSSCSVDFLFVSYTCMYKKHM